MSTEDTRETTRETAPPATRSTRARAADGQRGTGSSAGALQRRSRRCGPGAADTEHPALQTAGPQAWAASRAGSRRAPHCKVSALLRVSSQPDAGDVRSARRGSRRARGAGSQQKKERALQAPPAARGDAWPAQAASGRRRRLRSNLKAGRGGMQGLGRSGAQAWLGSPGGRSGTVRRWPKPGTQGQGMEGRPGPQGAPGSDSETSGRDKKRRAGAARTTGSAWGPGPRDGRDLPGGEAGVEVPRLRKEPALGLAPEGQAAQEPVGVREFLGWEPQGLVLPPQAAGNISEGPRERRKSP